MSGWFADDAGDRYDESTGREFEQATIDETVDFLEPLASGGALELAVGTGRIAVPLAGRGVRVAGADYSPAMVARLEQKSGDVAAVVGDMTTTRIPGTFSLVYLVFNSIMNLASQEEQVACFGNAAAHLEPGGSFVLEVVVPQLQRLPAGERFRVFHQSERSLGVDEYDVVTQALTGHYWSTQQEYHTMAFRYVWPSELDLMARIAGMRLRERWAGWTREPFTAESASHVSVWEKTAIETEVM